MPTWLYQLPTFALAAVFIGGVVAVSLIGLALARRFLLPRLRFHDGVNDAVSGAVQAIGVFYGVTVGLIAVAVWNNYANALDLRRGRRRRSPLYTTASVGYQIRSTTPRTPGCASTW